MRSLQCQGKIFSDQEIVLKNDANIELKVYFEVASLKRWAGEETGEGHVDGDLDLGADVAIANLQVLNFCCILAEAFCAASDFDPHQLDLDGLDGNLRVVNCDPAVQWFGDTADGRVDCTGDQEAWNGDSILR